MKCSDVYSLSWPFLKQHNIKCIEGASASWMETIWKYSAQTHFKIALKMTECEQSPECRQHANTEYLSSVCVFLYGHSRALIASLHMRTEERPGHSLLIIEINYDEQQHAGLCVRRRCIKWRPCCWIWIAEERLNPQRTVQARFVGEAEMTAFIKASAAGDRALIRKKASIIHFMALSIIDRAKEGQTLWIIYKSIFLVWAITSLWWQHKSP